MQHFQIASQNTRRLHAEMRIFRQGCRRNRKRSGRAPKGSLVQRELSAKLTEGLSGKTAIDNPSVICFANATVSLRLGHGAGLTAHRAVIQHRAAASLPYTGEAIRCGGIIDIKTDKLLAPARAFRSGQGGRAQAYGLYVKPGQRGHGRKDPAGVSTYKEYQS